MLERRKLLRLGLAAASTAICAAPGVGWAQALAGAETGVASRDDGTLDAIFAQALAGSETRRVSLHNIHTDETLDAVYWERGRYLPEVMVEVNRVLRDYHNDSVYPIHPNLIDLLGSISAKVEKTANFKVVSGYRSPATNAAMHERSAGVAKHSLHMEGMAIDIRLDGVDLSHLHKAALDVGQGGVGFYPQSDFVHVDVGPVRRWQGV